MWRGPLRSIHNNQARHATGAGIRGRNSCRALLDAADGEARSGRSRAASAKRVRTMRRARDQAIAIGAASPRTPNPCYARAISSDPMKSRLIFSLLLISVTRCQRRLRAGAGQGQRQSEATAAAGQSERSEARRQGIVRPQAAAGGNADACDRLLRQGLHRRRRSAADHRRHLAGDAAVAQSQLGASRHGQAAGTAVRQGAQGRGLARASWSATCRSRAAARCSPVTPAIRSDWTPTSG